MGMQQINPGEGYRLLNDGEPIEEGDEVLSVMTGHWEKSDCSRVEGYSYRRKIFPVMETAIEKDEG